MLLASSLHASFNVRLQNVWICNMVLMFSMFHSKTFKFKHLSFSIYPLPMVEHIRAGQIESVSYALKQCSSFRCQPNAIVPHLLSNSSFTFHELHSMPHPHNKQNYFPSYWVHTYNAMSRTRYMKYPQTIFENIVFCEMSFIASIN